MEDFFRVQDLGLVFLLIVSTYFSIRYFALEHALRETALELAEIQDHVLQNRILRLPLPDKGLERLLKSINGALEQIRRERLGYEKREREFQQQIRRCGRPGGIQQQFGAADIYRQNHHQNHK